MEDTEDLTVNLLNGVDCFRCDWSGDLAECHQVHTKDGTVYLCPNTDCGEPIPFSPLAEDFVSPTGMGAQA